MDYDKLLNLDYTAYEHATDFKEKLRDRDFRHPELEVSGHYDAGVPVVSVEATGRISGETYTENYRLEGVSEKEFDHLMFDIWKDALEEVEKLY